MLNELNRQKVRVKEQIRAKRKLEAMLSQVEQSLRKMRLEHVGL